MSKPPQIIEQLHFVSIGLVATSLVWPLQAATYPIALWLLTFLISLFYKRPTMQSLKLNLLQPLPLLYIVYAIGLLYTTNMGSGADALKLKATFLAFPLFFANLGYTERSIQAAYKWFLISCFTALASCLAYATYLICNGSGCTVFFYTQLSIFIHVGYFAMMLNFALAIVFEFWHLGKIRTQLALIMAVVLAIFILMLSTKAGIAGLVMVCIYAGTRLGVELKKPKQAIGIFAGGLAIIIACTFAFPTLNNRLTAATEVLTQKAADKPGESTASRLAVWKDAVIVAKQYILTGAGTGDGKDKLMEQYQKSGNLIAHYRNYNAHNQYLQTSICVGIVGLFLLLASVILPLVKGFKSKHYIVVVYCILVGFNYLTEAVLERQVGVLFVVFFSSIFVNLLSGKETADGKPIIN